MLTLLALASTPIDAEAAQREMIRRLDEQGEPDGWMRHPTSGRLRPGGDATREYIRK